MRRVWMAVLLVPLAGCGAAPARPACHPVRGQVLVNGRPAVEALVVFHPQGALAGQGQRPVAYTNSQGRFTVTTWEASDGAPAGDYQVTVEWRAEVPVGEERERRGRLLIPEKYLRPETSGLKATVREGANDLPPFALAGP